MKRRSRGEDLNVPTTQAPSFIYLAREGERRHKSGSWAMQTECFMYEVATLASVLAGGHGTPQ